MLAHLKTVYQDDLEILRNRSFFTGLSSCYKAAWSFFGSFDILDHCYILFATGCSMRMIQIIWKKNWGIRQRLRVTFLFRSTRTSCTTFGLSTSPPSTRKIFLSSFSFSFFSFFCPVTPGYPRHPCYCCCFWSSRGAGLLQMISYRIFSMYQKIQRLYIWLRWYGCLVSLYPASNQRQALRKILEEVKKIFSKSRKWFIEFSP